MSVTIKYLKSPQNLLEPGLTVRIFYISLLHVTEYRSEKNKTKKTKKKHSELNARGRSNITEIKSRTTVT